MPFSNKFMCLFNRVGELSAPAFLDCARKILEEDPTIINQIDEEVGASTLLFSAISLYEKRLKRSMKIVDNDKCKMEESNVAILVGLLLEKGANPNFSWPGDISRTATDYFIKFLAVDLCLSGSADNLQILLNPYKSLMELFIKQKAQFKLDQFKEGPVKTTLHKFIAETIRNTMQIQLGKQEQTPSLRR